MKWTKCKEKLPDEKERVLVWHKDTNYVDICSATVNPWTLRACWEDDNGIYCAMRNEDMWFPLPVPSEYKKEEKKCCLQKY